MMQGFILTIFTFFKSLGLVGAFLSMFIENIGIPLPTEIGYLIGQNAINLKTHSYFLILFILTFGHLNGSLLSYWIGRSGNKYVTKKLQENSKIKQVKIRLEKWYAKYGNLTLFITRFVGYVRPWSSYVAGFAKVDFWPFVLWTTLGSILFNVICLYTSGIFITVWRQYSQFHIIIMIVMFISFFGALIYELIKFFHSLTKQKNG